MYFGDEINFELKKFLSILFDEEDLTCFAENVYDTTLSDRPKLKSEFVSINPMLTSRKDDNVTKFRNFLIEIDNEELSSQLATVLDKIPVSTIVYSGSKSYHFIVSLEHPVTRDQYSEIMARLLEHIPQADKATKNPSRLSRLPLATRSSTGKLQNIVYLGSRISLNDILSKLPEINFKKPQKFLNKSSVYTSVSVQFALNKPDEAILNYNLSGRNAFFFWLGNRLRECGKNEDTIYNLILDCYNNLKDKSNFSIKEALAASRLK